MYKLRFLRNALKDLKKIDRAYQKIIKEKLLILSQNPAVLSNNIKRLCNQESNVFRLRVGSYRVLFQKNDDELVILVIRIGHRKEIYLSLE